MKTTLPTATSQLRANPGGYRDESFAFLRANPTSAPIVVTIYPTHAAITDGRHRLAIALERCAATILAEVWTMGPRGGTKRVGVRELKLDGVPQA